MAWTTPPPYTGDTSMLLKGHCEHCGEMSKFYVRYHSNGERIYRCYKCGQKYTGFVDEVLSILENARHCRETTTSQ